MSYLLVGGQLLQWRLFCGVGDGRGVVYVMELPRYKPEMTQRCWGALKES